MTLRLPEPPRDLCPGDPHWPGGLDGLGAEAPARLRVAGRLPQLDASVAIVGSRAADDDGLAFTRDLARNLAARGWVVISGGARGIDAAAHLGALETGDTVAVLASGLRRAYPRRHTKLFERIAQRGALVSEAPDQASPQRWLFLKRNRLIAALARAVVVVQAPLPSGALSTAAWARRLGRPVLAVPGAPWDPLARGCQALLAQGARCCTGPADVLSVAGAAAQAPAPHLPGSRQLELPAAMTAASAAPAPRPATPAVPLDPEQRRVLDALSRRPAPVDTLCTKTGLEGARVQVALLHLLLQGLAEETRPGSYRIPATETQR